MINVYILFQIAMTTEITGLFSRSGGFLYLDGRDALGYEQAWNNTLLSLFGIASASDGIE